MKKEEIADSLLFDKKFFDGERRQTAWLFTAYKAYNRLHEFRNMRAQCKDYAYGKQYSQTITVNGRTMTKEQYLEERGIPALQTNILGKLKRTVQGQYRLNDTAPTCTAVDPNEKKYADCISTLLKQNMKLNKRSEIDARCFEEFLISGLAVYKVTWAFRKGKLDCFQDYVNPNLVFFPDSLDFSLEDVRYCGMLHDLDFQVVLEKFSHSDADDSRLKDIYRQCQEREHINSMFSRDSKTYNIEDTDFFVPAEYGKCRVIELWTKERRRAWYCDDPLQPEPYFVPYNQKAQIEETNQKRLELNIKRNPDGTPMVDEQGNEMHFVDPTQYAAQNLIVYERRIEAYWYYRYLSPDGFILEEGETPYWNGSESFHPFVFKPYPFIDGEFHPFIAEIIPSQEYFNYYMVALDFYIRNAAKGALMIDKESVTEEMPIEDINEQHSRTTGTILYTSKNGGHEPKVMNGGTIPGGFDYFIQLSRTLSEDVSGAQAALQGKNAGQSGVLYQAQVQQASSTVLDLLKTYNSFLTDVAMKVTKVIRAFYRGKKQLSVAGEIMQVDMDTTHDVDLDISIAQDTDTPVYRALTNNLLLGMAEKGILPLRVAIEGGDFPNGAKIISMLDQVERQQQEQIAAQAQAATQQTFQQPINEGGAQV